MLEMDAPITRDFLASNRANENICNQVIPLSIAGEVEMSGFMHE
jgi:hypothetical protein